MDGLIRIIIACLTFAVKPLPPACAAIGIGANRSRLKIDDTFQDGIFVMLSAEDHFSALVGQ